ATLLRPPHQLQVASAEVAHGGHKADALARLALLGQYFANTADGAEYFHRGSGQEAGRLMSEVGRQRVGPQLRSAEGTGAPVPPWFFASDVGRPTSGQQPACTITSLI